MSRSAITRSFIKDGDGLHFMNSRTTTRCTLPEDVIGDQSAYLQPDMKVMLTMHDGRAISIELPQRSPSK